MSDLYFARAILKGLRRGAFPPMSMVQESKLSSSWLRLARTLCSLSANGPSGAPAFKKTIENPKFTGKSDEKRLITVANVGLSHAFHGWF